MAAPPIIYIDSDIGTDTGTGTSGDPYGNIQYALDSVGASSDGHRFLGRGSETLSAPLDFTTYGNPGTGDSLFIVGNDPTWNTTGTDWEFDCDGTGFKTGTQQAVCLVGCRIVNIGNTYGFYANQCDVVDCYFEGHTTNTVGNAALRSLSSVNVTNCTFENCVRPVYASGAANNFYNCTFLDGATNKIVVGLHLTSSMTGSAVGCKFLVSGSGTAVILDGDDQYISNAAVSGLSSDHASTVGIEVTSAPDNSNIVDCAFQNLNIGCDFQALQDREFGILAGNVFRNCGTNEDIADGKYAVKTNNSTATADLFDDADNGDFSPTDELKSYTPFGWTLCVGAVQEGSGGGSSAVLVSQGLHGIESGITA